MKLFEIHNNIEYINVIGYEDDYDDESELDIHDLISQAEKLVHHSGMHMLRDDNFTDLAIIGDSVIGAMYTSTDGETLRMSIAVDPRYRGSGIATQLYKRLDVNNESTLVAELIPPYTMEKFVKDRGFTLVNDSNGFKVYRKEL